MRLYKSIERYIPRYIERYIKRYITSLHKHLRNMVPARSNVFRQQFGIWSSFSVLVVQPALGVFARATVPLFRSSQEGEYLCRFQSQQQFFELHDGWLCNRRSHCCYWLVVGFKLMKLPLVADIIRFVE